MNQQVFLFLAIGGTSGTLLRYLSTNWMLKNFPHDMALGTLAVNIIGSFLIGIMMVLIQEKLLIPESFRPLLITGFLGGLTTFSSFSMETVNHILRGQYGLAISYVLLSVLLCLLACFAGIMFTRQF